MPVFDLFKRWVGTTAASGERRAEPRVRATLGAQVLVVDDSPTIRAVLGKMLVQDGYQVSSAGTGEEAIDRAVSQHPDLVFLDIVLPGMSGFAALRALRRDGRTRDIPIVMMSGNQQATEQFYVQRFGADGFIRKPFGRNEVFHAIRSLVQAGRLEARETPAEAGMAVPDGMSPEEWDAIPDVAMPDEASAGALVADATAATGDANLQLPQALPDAPVPADGPRAGAPHTSTAGATTAAGDAGPAEAGSGPPQVPAAERADPAADTAAAGRA